MLAERKDLGQLRASEAGTGSESPHPISVILTKASKARGAEGPRTASRKRSRYRFRIAASKSVIPTKTTNANSVILTEASKARGAEGPRTASRQRSRYRFQVSASKLIAIPTEASPRPERKKTAPPILGSPSMSPEYPITLARFFAGEGTASAPGVRVFLQREGGQGVRFRTSQSFAPVPSLRIQTFFVILTGASDARGAEGPRTASRCEAGTGSESPHPISVILTKASKARGAEGPRTASRQRSRYRFQVSASDSCVILTEASNARGAEGPRTASRSEAGTGS
jgi:hypothetical protein